MQWFSPTAKSQEEQKAVCCCPGHQNRLERCDHRGTERFFNVFLLGFPFLIASYHLTHCCNIAVWSSQGNLTVLLFQGCWPVSPLAKPSRTFALTAPLPGNALHPALLARLKAAFSNHRGPLSLFSAAALCLRFREAQTMVGNYLCM